MKALKNTIITILLCCSFTGFAQSDTKEKDKNTKDTDTIVKAGNKENTSEETITKIIRIKGANGEEKVIKEQQVITKKSNIKLNPEDESEVNQTATYTPEEVSIKNSGVTSSDKIYSSIPDGTGYILTIMDEKGQKTSKARPLSNGYFIVHNGLRDNCIGHFDDNKNLILEMYDSEKDTVISLSYKQK